MLFRRSQDQVGEHIVEQAAAHARQIGMAIEEHGLQRVEAVLDAALALEQHIDIDQGLRRPRYPELMAQPAAPPNDEFSRRFAALGPDTARPQATGPAKRAPIPPHPERDLLWFIAQYAPELEPWERDIFLAVREESFYFYPVFACQIMNEGWASYWHARLLREADFLPQSAYVDAIKCHSDVVRPSASGESVALSTNPYHLGFSIWEKIVEEQGLDAARKIMCEDDDFGFVRNHLTHGARAGAEAVPLQGPGDRHADGAGDGSADAARSAALAEIRVRRADRERRARARRRQAGAGARPHGRRPRPGSGARTQGAGICRARVAPTGDDRDSG